MYFDNLTIAGLVAATLTALIPFLFGREMIRVREDEMSGSTNAPSHSEAGETVVNEIDCATAPETCS